MGPGKRKVLLIGWDAADWKFINPLLDAGRMPNLSRLVDGGVVGNLASLSPCLSPILWTSIVTGKTADKHGITGFVEPVPGGGGVRLTSSTSRTTKAIWNILSQKGLRSQIFGWYASHPAEPINGTIISNRFLEGLPRNPADPWEVVPESVHPQRLESIVSGLRMHSAEFRISDLKSMIPEIHTIDLATDQRPGKLASILAKTVSLHSVATGALEAEPWDFAAIYYDGIDVAGHVFMPYHSPKMPNVSDRDFCLYQNVMTEVYLFHDEMLGRLLELTGEDTSVMLVSDHGFHSDHLRPLSIPSLDNPEAEAAAWHRHYGVIAMSGPGMLKDERIYGASLLDITPTILHLFDLSIGLDMDGRPLIQAFENPPADFCTTPSWDFPIGESGMHPLDYQQTAMESPEAIEQLIALGYLPAETVESKTAVEIAIVESKFNLAIVHNSHGRPLEAMNLLEELHLAHPDHPRYAIALAKAYSNLAMSEKCQTLLEKLEATGHRSPDGDLMMAAVWFNAGRHEEAFARLAETEQNYPPAPAYYLMLGRLHASREDWQPARAAWQRAIDLNDDDPHAHNGLAQAELKLGDFESAADHALRAVGLLFFYPMAHFVLGMAFKGMGEIGRAIRSLDLAVTQSPGFLEAHQELSSLYEQTNNVPLWMNHQRMARGMPPLL